MVSHKLLKIPRGLWIFVTDFGLIIAMAFPAGVACKLSRRPKSQAEDRIICVQGSADSDWLFRNKWANFGMK